MLPVVMEHTSAIIPGKKIVSKKTKRSWGNLGACLIMQQRYGEAEVALQRALAIDPKYEFARHNLAALPSCRQSSQPPISRISGPFDEHTLKKSLTFRVDQ
ncbi:MAG TPA: tetratricopeptide repeat protein [Roseiflexaceae bacterium]|jgi:tetratricopeptide (TPR) repeat protein